MLDYLLAIYDIVHLVWPDIWPFGLYVIRLVTALLYVPLVIILVACTGPYLRSTIIWTFIALLHVYLGLISLARTGLYIRITIIWQLVPVTTATLWHVLGHILVSHSYLSTKVPLTL